MPAPANMRRGRANGAVLDPEHALEDSVPVAGAGSPPEPDRMPEEAIRIYPEGPVLNGKSQYAGLWVDMVADPPSGDADALFAAKTNGELREHVLPMVLDWNMKDRKGDPIPVSPEGALRLSYRLVNAIVAAYYAHLARLQAPVPNSDDGSSAT